MASNSDELSTEISSSLSSPFGNSCNRKGLATASSQVERLDEADKQILEWAGKLEMESVDLREKSSQLVQVLQSNSDELCGLVKKLNGMLSKQRDLNEIRSSIKELGSRLEDQLGALSRQSNEAQETSHLAGIKVDLEADLRKLESTVLSSFEAKQKDTTKSIEQNQELLFNLSRQLEDTHQIMISMSKDITTLNHKQTSLEHRIRKYESSFSSDRNDIPRMSSPLPTIKAANDVKLLNDGPITRSMSKRKTTSTKVIAQGRVEKPRDIAITRTIIPWDEVDTYYASEI